MEFIDFPAQILGAILLVILVLVGGLIAVFAIASSRRESDPDMHVTGEGSIDETRRKGNGRSTHENS